MDNNLELLAEIRQLFEDNDVEVIMVNKPISEYGGEIIPMVSRKCDENYRQDILDSIKEDKIERVFLYQASSTEYLIDNEVTHRVTFRSNWAIDGKLVQLAK